MRKESATFHADPREYYESLGKGKKRVKNIFFYLFRKLWISDSESTRKMLPESIVKNEIGPMDVERGCTDRIHSIP